MLRPSRLSATPPAEVRAGTPSCENCDREGTAAGVGAEGNSNPSLVASGLHFCLCAEAEPQGARIKLRLNRNPVIGDKFSSRHGQKGVLSILWPQVPCAGRPFLVWCGVCMSV